MGYRRHVAVASPAILHFQSRKRFKGIEIAGEPESLRARRAQSLPLAPLISNRARSPCSMRGPCASAPSPIRNRSDRAEDLQGRGTALTVVGEGPRPDGVLRNGLGHESKNRPLWSPL